MLIGYNAGPKWIYYYKTGKHKLPEETANYLVVVKKFYVQFSERLSVYLPGNVLDGIERVQEKSKVVDDDKKQKETSE